MIIVDLTQLAIPQIIKTVIDSLNLTSLDRRTLLLQCLLILGLGLVMAGLRYCWRILLMGSARDLEKGVREEMFNHILKLDMPYYNTAKTGDIMAHATSDINHVRMAFGFGLMVLVDTILLGGATLAIMIWTHPKLTAYAMIPMPFLVVMARYLGRKMHRLHKTAQESFSLLTELIRERFYGIRIIKVFNFEAGISGAVNTASTDYFQKNLKRAYISALLKPLMNLFFNLSTLIVLFYGGVLVMQQTITPGELVAFLQYLGILAWPVIAIGWMTNLFQRGLASLNRINLLLDSQPEIRSPDHGIRLLPDTPGELCFDNVCFSYDKTVPILSDITMDIPKGGKIGIIGPPGSGKSTLAHLIPRLYDITGGRLTMDGHRLSSLDLENLRQRIAFMPQEAFLFSGTIKDNILLGQQVTQKQIDDVIQWCCLSHTIEAMPHGLDTLVGERGITLSGGQKQRIALARTLLLNRPIMILDDPVSQIDTQTASQIISRLGQISSDTTLIMISHRISALSGCDAIYVLNHGRVEDSGSHDVLIQRNRFYKDACQVQQFEEMHHA